MIAEAKTKTPGHSKKASHAERLGSSCTKLWLFSLETSF